MTHWAKLWKIVATMHRQSDQLTGAALELALKSAEHAKAINANLARENHEQFEHLRDVLAELQAMKRERDYWHKLADERAAHLVAQLEEIIKSPEGS